MSTRITSSVAVLILIVTFGHFESLARPEYTALEKSCLVKFREIVKDVTYKEYMKSDPYLIRWLRAKKFKLAEANKMLRTTLKWRLSNKIDGILNETVFEFNPPVYTMDGIDYEGSTVFAGYARNVNLKAELDNGKKNAAIRYFTQSMEMIEIGSLEALGVIGNSSSPKRDRTDVVTLVMDLDGYSSQKYACVRCVSVYVEWAKVFENYYPGYYRHIITVNAPSATAPMLKVIKPLISPPLRKALIVYGKNREIWIPELQKIVPSNQLRPNFGGTKLD